MLAAHLLDHPDLETRSTASDGEEQKNISVDERCIWMPCTVADTRKIPIQKIVRPVLLLHCADFDEPGGAFGVCEGVESDFWTLSV